MPLVGLERAGRAALKCLEHLPGELLDFGLGVGMPAHAEEIIERRGGNEDGDGRKPFEGTVGPLFVQAEFGQFGHAGGAGVGHAVPDRLGHGGLFVRKAGARLHAADIGAPPERVFALQRAQALHGHGARAAGVAREQAVGHEFSVDPAGIPKGQGGEADTLRRNAVGDNPRGNAHGRLFYRNREGRGKDFCGGPHPRDQTWFTRGTSPRGSPDPRDG